jgi:hypothetical protein
VRAPEPGWCDLFQFGEQRRKRRICRKVPAAAREWTFATLGAQKSKVGHFCITNTRRSREILPFTRAKVAEFCNIGAVRGARKRVVGKGKLTREQGSEAAGDYGKLLVETLRLTLCD